MANSGEFGDHRRDDVALANAEGRETGRDERSHAGDELAERDDAPGEPVHQRRPLGVRERGAEDDVAERHIGNVDVRVGAVEAHQAAEYSGRGSSVGVQSRNRDRRRSTVTTESVPSASFSMNSVQAGTERDPRITSRALGTVAVPAGRSDPVNSVKRA